MKEVKAYRCQYCGKLYLTKRGCERHENDICTKSPERRPLCYNCKNYRATYDEHEREKITITEYLGEDVSYQNFYFYPNKCHAKICKLFFNVKLSEELQDELYENRYIPMPSVNKGCECYEEF